MFCSKVRSRDQKIETRLISIGSKSIKIVAVVGVIAFDFVPQKLGPKNFDQKI